MKRILILANNDVGLYKFRKELIQELLKENEVYISLPDGDLVKPLISLGCKFINTPVDRRGINPITDLKLINQYRKIFNQVKPDLAITYTIKPNIYASLIARLKKIEYAVNITGLGTIFQDDRLLKNIIVRMYSVVLKKVKVVFFENEENRDVFLNKKIISKDKTLVLNGAGVNLDEYPLTKYPDENEDIRFLFIGRIMKEKGIDEFLYAAKKIKSEYPSVQFDIVGPMEDNYQKKIKIYVSNNIVNYYGFQDDVRQFIINCHCLILPSYHEGMANTLLEAGAMGRLLIASDISGCKEALFNDLFLVKAKSATELYLKIKEFINIDYLKKVEFAQLTYKHIRDNFNKSNVVSNTIKGLGLSLDNI